jgi:hypothetical protein
LSGSDELNGGDENDILNAQDGVANDCVTGGFGFDRCFAAVDCQVPDDLVLSCEELNL